MGLNSIPTTLNNLEKLEGSGEGGVAYKRGKIACVSSSRGSSVGMSAQVGAFLLRVILGVLENKEWATLITARSSLLGLSPPFSLFGFEDDFVFTLRTWVGGIVELTGVELGLDGGLCQAPVAD